MGWPAGTHPLALALHMSLAYTCVDSAGCMGPTPKAREEERSRSAGGP